MVTRVSSVLTIGAILAVLAVAQEGGLKSGPQPAPEGERPTRLNGSFQAYVFNGRQPERFRSVVCENDYFPTAIFFLKEPADGKDAPFKKLFARLDEVIVKYQAMDQVPEVASFAAYAVFLSEAAQTSLNGEKLDDAAALVREATARRALNGRMRDWAKDLKGVVVAATVPENVKAYELNPMAEITGLYYESFNVLENWAFAEGAFKESDADAIVERIEQRLQAHVAKVATPAKKAPKK